jgi:predicted cupin superfamily sugar epimerase
MLTADGVIELLNLEPLPVEGGFFKETYRATETLDKPILPGRYTGTRVLGTAIYYLLRGSEFSALHQLCTDEVYHFYLGRSVELLLLSPDGGYQIRRLGYDLEAGERPQATVPCGVWQALRLIDAAPDDFALLGTTMAPGFDPADFELGDRGDLLLAYPECAQLIYELTRLQERDAP